MTVALRRHTSKRKFGSRGRVHMEIVRVVEIVRFVFVVGGTWRSEVFSPRDAFMAYLHRN